MVRHTSKFERGKRNPNVTNQSCLLPIKRKRDNSDAWLSQIDTRTVMNLVDFRSVSWIWEYDYKDYINKLPDDILVLLLSRLTIKEAARTSILSSRWRDLWKFISGTLDLDFNTVPDKEQHIFVEQVNHFMKSLLCPTVNELKIRFHGFNYSNFKCDIDNWINFAIVKRVGKLQLDLRSSIWLSEMANYKIPSRYLVSSSFKSLVALRLRHVDVTNEDVKYFLSNCPLLEVLSLADSKLLENLEVCGPTLKLKILEIESKYIKSIEISVKSLVSFTYYGQVESMSFKDVPRLAKVSFGGNYGNNLMEHKLTDISSYLSKLEMLTLTLSSEIYWTYQNFSELSNLKLLELRVSSFNDKYLLSCISLMEASPMLHKFTLQFQWTKRELGKVVGEKATKSHQSLEVVELVGFKGFDYDVALANYLLEYAKLLEKFIINPRDPIFEEHELESRIYKKGMLERRRSHARKLKPKLPPRAKLVIL